MYEVTATASDMDVSAGPDGATLKVSGVSVKLSSTGFTQSQLVGPAKLIMLATSCDSC
jgi:hypothetical protein